MPGFRNYGPNVSQAPQAVTPGTGSFSDEEHSWETVLFQFDKLPLDWEFNLFQGILGNSGSRSLLQKTSPSGFVTNDFLERAGLGGSYAFLASDAPAATTANKFRLVASDVNVNGWLIRLDLTDYGTPGLNTVTLPAPPAGAGVTRVDLVILEVWRALIRPAPSTTNKSPTGQILRHGNAKAPDGAPLGNQNLADDLIDPVFTHETNARVQIQYRLRAISGVNLSSFPDGLDDPNVFANTVPYQSASDVNGAVTAYNYSKSATDPGLWVAGVNSSVGVTNLGTADGLMYAIPVCAVYRRNSTAFNRSTNLNGGGLMASAVSGRPDGLYSDQIVEGDVRDLRRGVVSDLHEVLQKSLQQVLDNSLQTSAEMPAASNTGVTFLTKDDIQTSGPPHIGSADGVRRFFSDRSVTETVVAKVAIGAATNTFNVDLQSLQLSWSAGTINMKTYAPPGTNIRAVNAVRIVDSVALTDKDGLDAVSPYVQSIAYAASPGPEQDRITITTDVNISNVTVYVELAIEYPTGVGARRNLLSGTALWAPQAGMAAWVDQTGWSATSDANRYSVPTTQWWVDEAHRELAVRLLTVSQSLVTFHTYDVDRILIWERLTGDPITITDGVNPPYATTNYTYNSAYTTVVLTGGTPRPAGVAVQVTYTAFRAPHALGGAPNDSYNFFYQTRAIQSIAPPAGTQTLSLIPRAVSKVMSLILSGSGSPDSPFPFTTPSCQVPVGAATGGYVESRLDNPNPLSLVGIGINTGYAEIPSVLPYAPSPQSVTLFRDAPDTTVDGDGRFFWPKSDDGLTAVYSPVAYGQVLSNPQRHKVVLAALMELKSDFQSIGRKGTLVLVLFSKWFEYNDENSITLTATSGDSAAAVFRVRGNLLNSRRSDV
jgi:hypothetical protein